MKNFTTTTSRLIVWTFIVSGLIYSLIPSGGVSPTKYDSSSPQKPDSATIANSPAESVFSGKEEVEQLKQDESLAAAIQTARYSVELTGDKFYAANPANKMRAIFEDAGSFSLQSASLDLPWETVWKLKSVGRGSAQQAIAGGDWLASETKISTRHRIEAQEAMIEERFENRPEGLEQVFVIEEKPRSEIVSGQSALRLVLGTSGDLIAKASEDGQTVDLTNKGGEKILRYEKLKVWDANYRELTARMRTETAGEIWLEVEDANAVYPITVDPSFVQQYKLTRPDSVEGDSFGETFAYNFGSTSYLAIGAPDADVFGNLNQGAVYIFEKTSSSNWTFKQKITASDGAAGDNFGSSLSQGWGTEFWVGAPNDNVGSNADQGSAYKFEFLSATGEFILSFKVLATDGAAGDNFGSKIFFVSLNDIFISAPDDDVDVVDQGSVYWINQDTGGHRRRLNAADGAANDGFGDSIVAYKNSDTGDIKLISGAPSDDNGDQTSQGSVYILNYDFSANTWTQAQKLLASDGALGDNFGSTLLLEDDQYGGDLYIGAIADDIDGNSGEGSVYYYENTGSAFIFRKKITASDGAPFDRFGSSLGFYSLFNSTLVVGSPFADIGSNQNQGAVYLFRKETINGNVTFRQSSKRSSPDGADNDHFGSAVLLQNDRDLIVSSPDDDDGSVVDKGSVSIMRRAATFCDFDRDFKTDLSIFRPSNGQWWYEESNFDEVKALQFGASTDRIMPGDFTGDGKSDIALFRPSTGFWYVLRSEDFSFYSFPFGLSTDIPTVGDFDGDGKSDPAVFRSSNATWYISRSSGGTTIQQFGANGDVPVAADYDDDGKTDIAIYRTSLGQWWIQRSALGTIAYTFGNSADKPVQGDYTGDGKTDVAIWRPSTGEWFVLRSENNSYYSFPFGTNGDIPAAGDYDYDGKFDAAIFRPSTATWYIQRSALGTLIQQFGANGDRPVPSAFVP